MVLNPTALNPTSLSRSGGTPVSEDSSEHRTSWRETLICQAVLVLSCVALGLFATQMNNHFYRSNQPFFDSIDYHFRTHQVMTICHEQGLFAALRFACVDVTVCLPFLIAAFAGLVFDPSRHVGIWIQTAELACFCLTAWTYFSKVHRFSPLTSLATTAPFFLLQCLYMNNGGLSDYRMDLSLAILFATTCLWYFIASRGESQWSYWLFGISCAATCLFRGTAPIYFIIALGPVLAWDLVFGGKDKSFRYGIAKAIVIATVLSIWFYILNFKTLYYYYFVWNTDANAHLPLNKSVQHFFFVLDHVGNAAILYVVAFHLLVLFHRLHSRYTGQVQSDAPQWLDIVRFDCRLFWIALAPALFLTLRGAGLNPFVSMPSAIGFLLFALIPSPFSRGFSLNWVTSILMLVVFVGCWQRIQHLAWKSHDGESPHSMAAHQKTLDTIVSDMHANKTVEARFATSHSFYLNTHSLASVAIFDRVGARGTSDAIQMDNKTLRPDGMLSLSAEADWARTPGDSENEKLMLLTSKASEFLDYVIMPTEECSVEMRDRVAHNVINRYAVKFREELLSKGNWELISDEISNRTDETVQVFRNNRIQSGQRNTTP